MTKLICCRKLKVNIETNRITHDSEINFFNPLNYKGQKFETPVDLQYMLSYLFPSINITKIIKSDMFIIKNSEIARKF